MPATDQTSNVTVFHPFHSATGLARYLPVEPMAQQEVDAEGQGKSGGKAQPTIMVVDDNRIARKLISLELSAHGYRVIQAGSGTEALGGVAAERPDLILLDLLMDGMSGQELLGFLKSQTDFRAIPVLVVSGAEHPGARFESMALGAQGFVKKPVELPSLLDQIAEVIDPANDREDAG